MKSRRRSLRSHFRLRLRRFSPLAAHDDAKHNHHGGSAHGATATDGQPGNSADVTRTVRVSMRDQ